MPSFMVGLWTVLWPNLRLFWDCFVAVLWPKWVLFMPCFMAVLWPV